MIISSNQKRKIKSGPKDLKVILALSFLALIIFAIFLLKNERSNVYFCDMEQVRLTNPGVFKSKGAYFTKGETRSTLEAFNGKHSSKCLASSVYGPTLSLDKVNSGDIIEASVWQKSDEGYGSLIFQGEWSGYFNYNRKAIKTHRGWEQIHLIDTIPLGVRNKKLKVYPMLSSKTGIVYFDDLQIIHTKAKDGEVWADQLYNAPKLNLEVTERDLSKLKIKRTEALHKGNLIAGKKDLVKAKLKEKNEEIDVQIRLKGDLLDHLQGNKWSFRIVPEKGQSWNKMQEFSVHNSASRAHLLEWVFHKMLQDEGVLTTRYDFVQLALNDNDLGIYAYEEHFTYPLLYNQKRERGPILRISEDGLWQYAATGFADRLPHFESAHTEAFEGKDILNNQALKQQFLNGQQLLHDYVNGNKTPGELFDIESMAKFIAIQDVCMAWHAFNYTNQRFYYNALLGKLEPIGYDGYSDDGTKWFTPPLMYGAKVNSRVSKRFNFREQDTPFNYFLFNDYEFVEKYLGYLEKFTSDKYLQDFLQKHIASIKAREQFIQREYNNYTFNAEQVFKNAASIQTILYPAENITVKAYRNPDSKIVLENYHSLPIEILGFGKDNIDYKLDEPTILESYNKKVPVRKYSITVNAKHKNLFCRTLGTKKTVRLPVFNWPIPVSKLSMQKSNIENLKSNPNLIITDKLIQLKGGVQIIREDLLIPAGYEFQLNAGSEINLTDNASIVSYSPIYIKGTKSKPVLINGSEGGQGLLVLNANGESLIEHTVFNNLSARNKGGQIAEGSVTFYKSNFICKNCKFENSKSKDALSIINSKYQLLESSIANSSGDGIDANHSSGSISNLVLDNTGKDAIEITGGYAKLSQININKANGSGINVARNGICEISSSCSIKNAQKGIAASDLSKVSIDYIELDKVNIGFVVFQKLAEYGPATLTVKDFKVEEVKQLHLVDIGAILNLKGKKIDIN